jgi:site-specific DNA recombinase
MNGPVSKRARCAIYTRKSTEHNLDLAFTSLHAQREACVAYITSQAGEGWPLVCDHYDDGGLSGASLERPALQRLLLDVRAGKIDIVLVYEVDRLTRSLADFAKLIGLFDAHSVSFVSVDPIASDRRDSATTGHVAAASPSSVMNSRRFSRKSIVSQSRSHVL